MLGFRQEWKVGCPAFGVPLQKLKLGDRPGSGRADEAPYQVEHGVLPGRGAARHDEFLALACHYEHLVKAQLDVRKRRLRT